MEATPPAAQAPQTNQRKRKEGSEGPRIAFTDITAALPAALAVGAAAVYGVLIVAYSQFYSELGVRPNEVGLEFGPGLGGIAGMAIVILLVVALSTLYAYIYFQVVVKTIKPSPRFNRFRVWIISVFVAINCIGLLFIFIGLANDRADDAKHGRPVEPIEIFGLELVALRADLTKVVPADPKAVNTPAYEQLTARVDSGRRQGERRRLLYLGRSGSTLVVYDVDRQSGWHLPTSSFAVRALNCETSLPGRDPTCPR